MYRVLLVDDDPVSLKLMQRACDQAEMDVASAESGEEALEYMQSQVVNVLVTDLVMPGINGMELFLRARRQRPLLRGILISAHLDYETLLQVVEAGFDDCFVKPVKDFTVLTKEIDNCFERIANWKYRIAQLRGYTYDPAD